MRNPFRSRKTDFTALPAAKVTRDLSPTTLHPSIWAPPVHNCAGSRCVCAK